MLDILGPFGELVVGAYEYAVTCMQITIRHTHAHKGQPWNELADSLAAAAADDVFCLPPCNDWLAFTPSSADPWAWIRFPGNKVATQLPRIHANSLLVTPQQVDFQPVNVVQYKQVYSEGLTAKNITFVTYNACTLGKTDDSQQHKCGFDKAPFLASQFEQVHIVGIQEARTPQGDSILIGQHSVWYRISGGKTSSKSGGSILGNELWINLSLPFAHVNEKPAFFKKDDMTIVFKHPRLLAVRISNKHIDMFAVVAHSPHTASSESDRSAFWSLLSQVLEGKHPAVLLIDPTPGLVKLHRLPSATTSIPTLPTIMALTSISR